MFTDELSSLSTSPARYTVLLINALLIMSTCTAHVSSYQPCRPVQHMSQVTSHVVLYSTYGEKVIRLWYQSRGQIISAAPSQHDLLPVHWSVTLYRTSSMMPSHRMFLKLDSRRMFSANLMVSDVLFLKRPWRQYKLCAWRYKNYPVNNKNNNNIIESYK